MASDNRPLSPHLQIYRPQLTSIMSISHRITGVGLSVGTLLLVWWVVAAAAGPEAYDGAAGFIGSFVGYILLFAWTFALFYHLCNGIRHLFWDAGYGLEIETAYTSGWAVLIASIALTVITWFTGLVALGGSS